MSPDSRPGTPSSRRTQLRPYNGDPRGPADSLAPSLNPRATLTGLQLARVASGMLHPEDRVSRPPQVDRRQLRRAFLSGELQHSGKTGGEGSRRGSGRRGAGRDEGQADGESGDSPDGLRGILPDRLQRLSDHISAWYAVDVQTEVLGTRVAGELRDRALAVELDTWSGRDGPRRAALLRGLSHAVLWQAEEIIVVAAERSGVPLGPDGLPVRGVDGTALLEVADMWDREIGDLLAGTLSIDKGGLMREEEGDRVPDLTLSRQKADSGGCIVM